ncbi:MAG TPA: aspartate 1-decarboxylase [Bacteroidales bacterium]|nr:aspartate 1-decarboxylase [Bacteroidales bacterium]
MQRIMCKSKIHRAVVTDANLNYEGSITIDEALMEAADLLPYERVQIVNNNNGARFETYVIRGKRNSGTICLNGAAARLVQPGDIVIVISYMLVSQDDLADFKPKILAVDAQNNLVGIKHDEGYQE